MQLIVQCDLLYICFILLHDAFFLTDANYTQKRLIVRKIEYPSNLTCPRSSAGLVCGSQETLLRQQMQCCSAGLQGPGGGRVCQD